MIQNLQDKDGQQEVMESTEIVVESDQESDQEDDGMFENFRKFLHRNVQQSVQLGNLASVRDLLLPNWCRIHNALHSELSCALCQTALEQVYKRIPQILIKEEMEHSEDESSSEDEILSDTSTESQEDRGTEGQENVIWTLRFDGSKSKQGSGAGYELISPTGETYLAAHRLQFPCTNNVAEYESLIHGLLMAIKKKAKILQVYGDSEIAIRQIRRQYVCHDKRLTRYRNRVWDLIESFEAFNINSIYRHQNQVANSLAQAASSLIPLAMEGLEKFTVELTSVPSVPDNITNFQVFEDDKHILDFLTNTDVFLAQIIDEEEAEGAELDAEGILNLKTNTIPKGMVELERIFDPDKLKEMKNHNMEGNMCDTINVGDDMQVKNVFIGKTCTAPKRNGILKNMRDFPDVIAWSYEDLNTYDTAIITHTIPLKPRSKPFRQRQRPVNPLLEPLIYQEVKKLLSAKIIFPVRHSTWVTNLVPVRKKSGEIRLCVDFRNLNQASEKDNYPLPSLDEVLQIVNGSQMMSFLDGYSGYNQVLVEPED